jgi:hypothetical protein
MIFLRICGIVQGEVKKKMCFYNFFEKQKITKASTMWAKYSIQ